MTDGDWAKAKFVTREEWESSERTRKERDAAAFQRECDGREHFNEFKKEVREDLEGIRDDVKTGLNEIKDDVKTVLVWQSQFKGGLKLLVGLVAFIGTLGGILKLFWPFGSK